MPNILENTDAYHLNKIQMSNISFVLLHYRCPQYKDVPAGCVTVPDPQDPSCCTVPKCSFQGATASTSGSGGLIPHINPRPTSIVEVKTSIHKPGTPSRRFIYLYQEVLNQDVLYIFLPRGTPSEVIYMFTMRYSIRTFYIFLTRGTPSRVLYIFTRRYSIKSFIYFYHEVLHQTFYIFLPRGTPSRVLYIFTERYSVKSFIYFYHEELHQEFYIFIP